MNSFHFMYFIKITHWEQSEEKGEWEDWSEYVQHFAPAVATNRIFRRYDKSRVVMHTTKNQEVALGFEVPEEAYALAAFTRLYLLDGEEDMETFDVIVERVAMPCFLNCEECKNHRNVSSKDCYECGANIDEKYHERVQKEIEQAKEAAKNMERYEVKRCDY